MTTKKCHCTGNKNLTTKCATCGRVPPGIDLSGIDADGYGFGEDGLGGEGFGEGGLGDGLDGKTEEGFLDCLDCSNYRALLVFTTGGFLTMQMALLAAEFG